MKVYLSKYWRNTFIFLIIIEILLFVGYEYYIIINSDFDFISLIFYAFYVLLFAFFLHLSYDQAAYFKLYDEYIAEYSFLGKRKKYIAINIDVYYQIITLQESLYKKSDYIILSNCYFKEFNPRYAVGITRLCKIIKSDENKMVLPYHANADYLSNISAWKEVSKN